MDIIHAISPIELHPSFAFITFKRISPARLRFSPTTFSFPPPIPIPPSVRQLDPASAARDDPVRRGRAARGRGDVQAAKHGDQRPQNGLPFDRWPTLASPSTYQMSTASTRGCLGHARSRGSAPGTTDRQISRQTLA